MAGSGVFPKTSTLDIVYQGDYNLIQSTIAGVLTTYYGQSTVSSQLAANPVIFASEWDLLRQDINKCYRHITNANSTILDVDPQDTILAVDANAYKVAADYCETNKATVNAAQLTSNVNSDSMTSAWNGTRTYKMSYTWTSADAATAWFNLGGYFVVDVSGSNAVSSKDIDWRDNILNVIPTQTYTSANWVTGTDISVYEYGNNAVYSENYARIFCNKISSTQLDISVIVSDVDSGDQTGIGPPVDENVDTDVAASITRYSSYDAIVAPSVSVSPLSSFNSTTPVTVDLLVVGGGGAGGSGWPDNIGGGGGGGGGGGVYQVNTTLQVGLSYPVTVGLGGTNIPYPSISRGNYGGLSSIAGYTGNGGQGGNFSGAGGGDGSGGTGGSSSFYSAGNTLGGAGGAYHSPGTSGAITGGGGGGGGGVDDADNTLGTGGSGTSWTVTGVTYAGGGGGGGDYTNGAAGGSGGGGLGASAVAGTAGTNGLGGGGGGGSSTGGGSWGPGLNGGSGVVVVSYVSGSQLFSGGSITNSGGRFYHTFTTSGTLS